MQQQNCFVNQDTTSHMCCRWDRFNRFFAVILQLQTKKGDDQCSVIIHLGSRQAKKLDEQQISLNIGIAPF